MTIRTVDDMQEATVSKLQDLARISVDSAKGFDLAATRVSDARLVSLFTELAAERRTQADELNRYVAMNEEETVDEGSLLAAFHRGWMKFRDSLESDDASAILSSAEYGEDQIKAAYEETLKETAGSPVNDVLTRQYANVKAAHDRVRDLRDACQAD